MKRSKFSENQIITILKAVEAGRTVADVCREHVGGDDLEAGPFCGLGVASCL